MLTFAAVNSDGVASLGIVQSREVADKAQVAATHNADGDVYATRVFGRNDMTLQMELLLHRDATVPIGGASLVHDDFIWHLTEVKRNESNEGWHRLSLAGTAMVSNGQLTQPTGAAE